MKNKIITLAAFLLFIIGCSTVKTPVSGPSQTDVDRVKAKYPDYSLADLTQGKNLYEQHCSTCHGLKKPTNFSEDQWTKIVPNMTNMANKKKSANIDAKQQELILRYVVTMSGAGVK